MSSSESDNSPVYESLPQVDPKLLDAFLAQYNNPEMSNADVKKYFTQGLQRNRASGAVVSLAPGGGGLQPLDGVYEDFSEFQGGIKEKQKEFEDYVKLKKERPGRDATILTGMDSAKNLLGL